MITDLIYKQANPGDIIIEFSISQLPPVLAQFYNLVKSEKVAIRKGKIPANVLNLYTISQRTNLQYDKVVIQSIPSNFDHDMCLIYLYDKQLQELGISINRQIQSTNKSEIQSKKTGPRYLVIREGMEKLFSIQYQIQETMGSRETGHYLCEITASLINRAYNKKIGFFDQKLQEIPYMQSQSTLTNVWHNALFQIPGLGRQKVQSIAKAYPTYSSIIQDYQGKKQLAKLQINRGGKSSKLGEILAQRIYKVMTSLKYDDNII